MTCVLGGEVHQKAGANDEPLRRGTDVVEGVAGDQRECGLTSGFEDPHVVGLNDPRRLDGVAVRRCRRRDPDQVAFADSPEPAEHPVPMARQRDIAHRTGHSTARDVTGGERKREVVISFHDHRLDPNPRDCDPTERIPDVHGSFLPVVSSPRGEARVGGDHAFQTMPRPRARERRCNQARSPPPNPRPADGE